MRDYKEIAKKLAAAGQMLYFLHDKQEVQLGLGDVVTRKALEEAWERILDDYIKKLEEKTDSG